MFTEQRNPNSTDLDQRPTQEILEIMNAEDASVAQAVRQALPEIARGVDAIVERLMKGGRLIYAGAGTSGRLALLDAAECPPTFNTPPSMIQVLLAGGQNAFEQAIEGAEDNFDAGKSDLQKLQISSKDVVVGIAASGKTPFVLGVLEAAREAGAMTVGISCNTPAPILDAVAIPIAVVTGPEVISGSTRLKAGTAQKMVLNMLSTASMIKLGKVYDNLMVDVRVSNQKLAARARGIVSEITGVSDEQAGQLLAQANHEPKTAVVMYVLGIEADEARKRLAEVGGMLRSVINQKIR
jgi:N-acetylmuramic acid 6-phosphate etherase